jgi:thioredoxin 1
VKELAEKYVDRLTEAKLDIDASPATPAKLAIRSIPTLLFFRDGKVVDSVVGAVPKSQLERKLEVLLA